MLYMVMYPRYMVINLKSIENVTSVFLSNYCFVSRIGVQILMCEAIYITFYTNYMVGYLLRE